MDAVPADAMRMWDFVRTILSVEPTESLEEWARVHLWTSHGNKRKACKALLRMRGWSAIERAAQLLGYRS